MSSVGGCNGVVLAGVVWLVKEVSVGFLGIGREGGQQCGFGLVPAGSESSEGESEWMSAMFCVRAMFCVTTNY